MKELDELDTPYVDAQTLMTLWASYADPRKKIERLVKKGELIRLKNGFYLIADKIHSKGQTYIPYEQVANLLYGPSYVSLEWALSFYGMIPERVYTVTSITLGRKKEFETPIGKFIYQPLPVRCYPVGITQKQATGFVGNFWMATPEKALADLVYTSSHATNKHQLKEELLESLRIDIEALQKLDKSLIADIDEAYRSTAVRNLAELIGII